MIKESNPNTIATFDVVTGVMVGNSYMRVQVNPVTLSGTFADGDTVRLYFSRTGDQGDAGPGTTQGQTCSTAGGTGTVNWTQVGSSTTYTMSCVGVH